MGNLITDIEQDLNSIPDITIYGKVSSVKGLLVEMESTSAAVLSIGSYCKIEAADGKIVPCEVIGFNPDSILLMPFTSVDGIAPGCRVDISSNRAVIYPDVSWLGRVINAFGEPIDDKGPLTKGPIAIPIRNSPPPAHKRNRVRGKVDLGVKAMNTFLTLCKGQRMGIFAGSGVGKSSLISMMAKHTDLDIAVVGLIGERGKEAREFLEDDLGEEGVKKSVVVLATSDESALMRKQAAYMTMAVAEYFRDLGNDVLCMMDSVTRFAMAQREIGLSAGEPPASKGYTPSVFAELPKLLERAGPSTGKGSISGLFTVLVEGDDHNEPISDAVRGILDGHVILDRSIAERNRFPAINILRSISRSLPAANAPNENALINRARKILSVYDNMAELIRLGAYRAGSNPEVDEAIIFFPKIEEFIAQEKDKGITIEESYKLLTKALA